MIIGRLIGYIFICLMVMVAGAEALRHLEGDIEGWIMLSEVIDFITMQLREVSIIDTSEKGLVQRGQNIIEPVLHFPALVAFFTFGIILLFMSRRRIS